jgi:hypothetical protein
VDGDYINGKVIGRFKGDQFWGFKTWVLSVENHDDLISLHGLMFDATLRKVEE